jgi:hypothetical protein
MFADHRRVSSDSDRQNTDLQRDALLAAGVDARHVFEDHASGARDARPGLSDALELDLFRRISPAAWQHLHFRGLCAFRDIR